MSNKQILLWSPFGSGEHYCGPSTYTSRIHAELRNHAFESSLVHGYKEHAPVEHYSSQTYLAPFGAGSLANLRYASAGRKWMKANHQRFDLVHAISGFQATVSAAEIAKKNGLPVVLFVITKNGGLVSKGGLRELLGVYKKRQKIAGKFDAIIALSAEVEQELLALGIPGSSICRIPNFADTEKYQPLEVEQRQKRKQEIGFSPSPVVAFVGRVCQRKRPLRIVQAIAEMRRKGKEINGLFVGPYDQDSTYFQKIQQTVKDNDLENQIVFTLSLIHI